MTVIQNFVTARVTPGDHGVTDISSNLSTDIHLINCTYHHAMCCLGSIQARLQDIGNLLFEGQITIEYVDDHYVIIASGRCGIGNMDMDLKKAWDGEIRALKNLVDTILETKTTRKLFTAKLSHVKKYS